MNNLGDLDKDLNFHGDSEVDKQWLPVTPTIGLNRDIWQSSDGDIDPGTAYATGVRKLKDTVEEFGKNGGKAAKAYYKGARSMLHHKVMYKPCTCYDANGKIIESKCKK